MKHKSTVKRNGGGRIQMEEEHTIVSAAKGNRLQLIPPNSCASRPRNTILSLLVEHLCSICSILRSHGVRGCWCVDSVIGCNNNDLFAPQKSYSYRGCDSDYNYIVDYSLWRVYSMQCAEIVCY